MASGYFRNTFDGGLDTDINKSFMPTNKYVLAENVNLSGFNNKFFSLENVKGQSDFATLFNYGDNVNDILGVYKANFKIATEENVPCIVVFAVANTGAGYKYRIYAVRLTGGTVYELYQKDIGVWAGVYDGTLVVDAARNTEGNIDTLYFTDNFLPPGRLRCEIPSGYSPNFLTDDDILLLKKPALGTITLDSVTTGGSLLTGTYQLAYQLINPTNNKYTKFSLLTTPIHVYTTINSFTRAGIGLPSNKKIVVDITPTEDELVEYTHFRLAVVENIYTEDVITTDIGLTKVELVSDYLSSGVLQNYEIKSNSQIETETIDNIVIDLAAIDKAKTIEISENRLLLGNVSYKDLDYDNTNGAPAFASGSILKQVGSSTDSFSSDDFTSRYTGHFRGEVYRYAISYFDEFGNYSYPKTLDMSSVTNNQISGAIDMKFPTRSQYVGSTNYTLMDTATGRTISLGLRLTDIDNHPTWAKGFVILRAKRKKDVEFQTPVIPLSYWHGIGAVGEYPNTAYEGNGPTAVTYADATPMGPNLTYIPTNLFYGGVTATGLSGFSTSSGSTVTDETYAGESKPLRYINTFQSALIYPPDNIYKNTPFSFKGNEKLRTVDASTCRLFLSKFATESYNLGSGLNTSCSGSFFSSVDGDYYYDSVHTGTKPAIRSTDAVITKSEAFDNYDEGKTVGGVDVWKLSNLVTGGPNIGTQGVTHRSVAVTLDSARTVLGGPLGTALGFTSGTPAYVAATSAILDSTDFITSTGGLYGSRINMIEIANVINGLDDTRYGTADEYNEFIYTGTKVVFTNSEVTTYIQTETSLPKTVDVWGGDCIVSPHTFKVAGTAYSVINHAKGKTTPAGETVGVAAAKWTRVFRTDATGAVVMMPVALNSASQHLTVILESEYHGSARDMDAYETIGTYGFEIPGQTSESMNKAPYSYGYNINLNKQNDQKIFLPQDPLLPEVNTYKARILYSSPKVFQTTIEGFDTFPILNFYDLNETQGPLNKLKIAGDNLYAVQSSGIAYLATGEKLIELTDASTLGVKSGDVFGNVFYVDTFRGGQHTLGITTNGNSLFILDNKLKQIYKLSGQSLEVISHLGLTSTMATAFANTTPQNNVLAFYDFSREHVWFVHKGQNFCYLWNDKYKFWETNYTFGEDGVMGGVYLDAPPTGVGSYQNQLMLVGKVGTDVKATTMYDGERTKLAGSYVVPKVSFVVNPEFERGKILEAILVNANNRLDTLDVSIEREAELGNQTVSNVSLVPTPSPTRVEGAYVLKFPYDATEARLRGLVGTLTVKFPDGSLTAGANQINLSSVVTKYMVSDTIF